LEDGSVSVFSESIPVESPLLQRVVNDAGLKHVARLYRAIVDQGDRESNRVRLSLRWHRQALLDRGIDSMLKHWVAIEVLMLNDQTDIGPIKKAIASSYGISVSDVEDVFLIGRIFRYRSEVVHNGVVGPVLVSLLDYLQTLYVDLLYFRVFSQKRNKAKQFIDTHRGQIREHLNDRLSK
jgi:hypothetical protein